MAVVNVLMSIWTWFADNILTQPAYFIGLIVVIGYALLKRPWYEILAGFIKAAVGYQILLVGSSGLTSAFRPIIVGLEERFGLEAMVIDPYFGQNAIQAAMDDTSGATIVSGKSFSMVMYLLLFAFIFNILLVKFNKYTKCRALFTTGNVQVQQATTAYFLVLFCFPELVDNEWITLIIMTILLGCYWAVGCNLNIENTQQLTDGAGFTVAHQQMFGIYLASKGAEYMNKHSKKESKNVDDIELPGFLKIFNENLVATAILMTAFFGTILVILGKDFLIEGGYMEEDESYVMYIITTSFSFAVYLQILQLGVRTFVNELTASFQGISSTILKRSVPGVDCAVTFGFGAANAVTIGFLFGALGQFLAIGILILAGSPVIVMAGFVPLFFDNAVIGVYANDKGGSRACMLFPFLSGLIQVFGSALIGGWTEIAAYGGYLGMFDWATVWPLMTVIMKYLGYFGIVVCVVLLLAIPQLQYRAHPDTYFMEIEDWDQCKKIRAEQAAEKEAAKAAK